MIRSRSTVLADLWWLIGVAMAGLLVAVRIGAPGWVLYLLAAETGVGVFVYLAGFIYLGFKNPDALRSEWKSIG